MNEATVRISLFSNPRYVQGEQAAYLDYHVLGDTTGWRSIRLDRSQLELLRSEITHVLEQLDGTYL